MVSKLLLGCLVVTCLTVSFAWASSTPYEPPEGGDRGQKVEVPLQGTDIAKGAEGTAVLACNMAESQHRIQLAAKGVKGGGVYSVWLVKFDAEKKKVVRQTRVDNPNRALKADKDGKLAFASNLDACPQSRYNRGEVRYHADGNAKNAAGAKAALSGELP